MISLSKLGRREKTEADGHWGHHIMLVVDWCLISALHREWEYSFMNGDSEILERLKRQVMLFLEASEMMLKDAGITHFSSYDSETMCLLRRHFVFRRLHLFLFTFFYLIVTFIGWLKRDLIKSASLFQSVLPQFSSWFKTIEFETASCSITIILCFLP